MTTVNIMDTGKLLFLGILAAKLQIILNPPWIKLEWNEEAVLGDSEPLLAVKKFSAAKTTEYRDVLLQDIFTKLMYFSEYESIIGTQAFLSAQQNYPDLAGATNLFKCFLPQAWTFGSFDGYSAFVHPDGVFDDPKGSALRAKLYPRLRYRFAFNNELRLFDISHTRTYSLTIYSNKTSISFETIANLFDPSTIDACMDQSIHGPVPGIKDDKGDWNTAGHPLRVVHIGRKQLQLFAELFDGDREWRTARLPIVHAQPMIDVLERFVSQKQSMADLGNQLFCTVLCDEVSAQSNGIIKRNTHFGTIEDPAILSGPNIGVSNPVYKTARTECVQSSDYDIWLCTVFQK